MMSANSKGWAMERQKFTVNVEGARDTQMELCAPEWEGGEPSQDA